MKRLAFTGFPSCPTDGCWHRGVLEKFNLWSQDSWSPSNRRRNGRRLRGSNRTMPRSNLLAPCFTYSRRSRSLQLPLHGSETCWDICRLSAYKPNNRNWKMSLWRFYLKNGTNRVRSKADRTTGPVPAAPHTLTTLLWKPRRSSVTLDRFEPSIG